jgi:hypothetical protein
MQYTSVTSCAIARRTQRRGRGDRPIRVLDLDLDLVRARIAQVTVTGRFAGPPAGACLERAVQAAMFPAWSGAPQSFDFSYLLSD